MDKDKLINKMSNIKKVLENTYRYLGHNNIEISTRKNKKFMVF